MLCGCGYCVCKYHNFPILILCHLLQSHLKDKITAREQSVSTESSPKEEVTEEDRTGTNCDHIFRLNPLLTMSFSFTVMVYIHV